MTIKANGAGNIAAVLGGAFTPPPPEFHAVESAENQVISSMSAAGIEHRLLPSDLVFDGRIHRFQIGGGRKNNDGWYCLYGDGIAAGAFGDWSNSVTITWRADIGRRLSVAEEMQAAQRIEQARKLRQEATQRKHEAVAEVVDAVWSAAKPATAENGYLAVKGVQPHETRISSDGRLIVPLRDADGTLKSLQYIADDGSKRFHTGGKVTGCYHVIGDLDGGKDVYIAEGFATAATIHEQMPGNPPCVVAFSAQAMPGIANTIRERVGMQRSIAMIADNDESGTGKRYADQAADAIGAVVLMPTEVGTDFNDYWVAGGDLVLALRPPVDDDFLVPVHVFAAQPMPIRWLVKGWLQRDSLMMFFGPSGVGKSFIAIDWACQIAACQGDEVRQWNGKSVRGGGEVVYLAGEGHGGLAGRFFGWSLHNDIPLSSLSMHVSKYGTDLNTPQGYLKTVDSIRRHSRSQPCLIVVDTLHAFLHGDENSAQDAKGMIDACKGLMREFDCAVMLVHHTGVSADAQMRARGSSAWKGAMDVELCVSKAVDNGGTLSATKVKDGERPADLQYTLDRLELPGWFDEDGEQVTTATLDYGEAPPKPDSLHADKRRIMEIWHATGADYADNGEPYITIAAIERWLAENSPKLAANSAGVYARRYGGCTSDKLVKAGWIRRYRDGWCFDSMETLGDTGATIDIAAITKRI